MLKNIYWMSFLGLLSHRPKVSGNWGRNQNKAAEAQAKQHWWVLPNFPWELHFPHPPSSSSSSALPVDLRWCAEECFCTPAKIPPPSSTDSIYIYFIPKGTEVKPGFLPVLKHWLSFFLLWLNFPFCLNLTSASCSSRSEFEFRAVFFMDVVQRKSKDNIFIHLCIDIFVYFVISLTRDGAASVADVFEKRLLQKNREINNNYIAI